MFFDTHCHLTLFKDISSIISKARENSVNYILAVAMYYQDNWNILKFAKKYSEIIPALGIHPIEAPNLSNVDEKLEAIKNSIFENKVQVVGEIGLDRYFVKEEHLWKKQEYVFRSFLDLAEENNFTINLHGKYAEKELFKALSKYQIKNVVVHWFAGAPELIREGINRDYFFSITPAVFYDKRMRKVVELSPEEQLLSESDGPAKFKGKIPFIGEPALMRDVIQEISRIKQKDSQEIARLLYNNAEKIFL